MSKWVTLVLNAGKESQVMQVSDAVAATMVTDAEADAVGNITYAVEDFTRVRRDTTFPGSIVVRWRDTSSFILYDSTPYP